MSEVQNTTVTTTATETTTKLDLVKVRRGTMLRREDGVEFIYYGPNDKTGLVELVDLAKQTPETAAKNDWHATYKECAISLVATEVEKMSVVLGTTQQDYISDLKALRQDSRELGFRVGDKVDQMDRYGLTFAELEHQTGFEQSTLKQYRMYARAFPAHSVARSINVGISYFGLLLKDDLSFEDKVELLQQAAEVNMRRKDFEKLVAGHRNRIALAKKAEEEAKNPPVAPPTPEQPTPEAQAPGRPEGSAQDASKVTTDDKPVETANRGGEPAPAGIPHTDPSLSNKVNDNPTITIPSDLAKPLLACFGTEGSVLHWIENSLIEYHKEQERKAAQARAHEKNKLIQAAKRQEELAKLNPDTATANRTANLEFRTDPNTANGEKVPA